MLIEEELKSNEIDTKTLLHMLRSLLSGEDISYDEKSQIISSLHNPKIRDTVADVL
jgi:hypothetical protein